MLKSNFWPFFEEPLGHFSNQQNSPCLGRGAISPPLQVESFSDTSSVVTQMLWIICFLFSFNYPVLYNNYICQDSFSCKDHKHNLKQFKQNKYIWIQDPGLVTKLRLQRVRKQSHAMTREQEKNRGLRLATGHSSFPFLLLEFNFIAYFLLRSRE